MRFSGAILIGILILIGVFFAVAPFLIKAEPVQQLAITKVEELTEGEVTFDRFRLHTFPVIAVELDGFRLALRNQDKVNLKAGKTTLILNLISLLGGKAEISRVKIQDGEAILKLGGDTYLKEGFQPERHPLRLRRMGDGLGQRRLLSHCYFGEAEAERGPSANAQASLRFGLIISKAGRSP